AHADPHTLYLGSNVLFKTMDGGHSWDIISPDLTREDPGVPSKLGQFAEYSDPAKGKHRGVIYSIGPSFKDANTIWIGTDDGQIQITHDGGKSWQNITPPDLAPWSKVAQIEASHFDENTAYAAINRLRNDDLHAVILRTHDGGKSWQRDSNGIPDDQPVNAVREDPVRKGLLYAATELGVWYSLDDGDHWQSLQLNLPSTSVRDIVVHDNDLIAGTHGRSFWILDDITPLRQMESGGATTKLYQPETAYRIRRDNYTDTPPPPEMPAGQNPPEGAILNYSLASNTSSPVVIEISDAQGKRVRRFSSTDKLSIPTPKELNVPYYWIRMPHGLSGEAGMHRLVWDLRYPAPESLRHGYPIAAIVHNTPRYPLGQFVLPGYYTVKLTADGQTQSAKLTVKMDPRIKTTPARLQELFEAQSKLASAMDADFEALSQVRSLREQIRKLQPKAQGEAAQSLSSLDNAVSALEGAPGGSGRATATDSLGGLSGGLAQVYSVLDMSDAAPTSPQQQAIADLLERNEPIMRRWNGIRANDLAETNAKLKAAGLPVLDINRVSTATEEESEGDKP
ncbi:MAG: glycoside hydrolase, partial [Acidobacteriaceae bacterium]